MKPTDEIKVYCPYSVASLVAEDAEGAGRGMLEMTVPKGEYTISEEPLDGMMYVYQFIVTDIFGGTHYSDAAILEMNYTYDELKEYPLPDGQYAAAIEEGFQTNGASVVD